MTPCNSDADGCAPSSSANIDVRADPSPDDRSQLLGIVALCRVRYVYAADRLSVMLLASDGGETGDDVTLQLPCVANSISRPCDPPLLALRLFDPSAADGRTSLAPGPCPNASRATKRALRDCGVTAVHLPIMPRRGWMESLTPGILMQGELYLLPGPRPVDPSPEPDPADAIAMHDLTRRRLSLSGAQRLSELLVRAGHAQYPELHDAPPICPPIRRAA